MALEKALSASDEITTNFNRGGSVTKAIDNFYPYTNAAVQGIDKSARTFKDKPLQTSFKVALATAIPSIGAYLMQKDDQYRERYYTKEVQQSWIRYKI